MSNKTKRATADQIFTLSPESSPELQSLTASLMECLLDVPQERLQAYLADCKNGYMSEMCKQVLNARTKSEVLLDAVFVGNNTRD